MPRHSEFHVVSAVRPPPARLLPQYVAVRVEEKRLAGVLARDGRVGRRRECVAHGALAESTDHQTRAVEVRKRQDAALQLLCRLSKIHYSAASSQRMTSDA